jgi:hypothetical protein
MSEALKRAIELWREANIDARGAETEIFSKRGTTVALELIDRGRGSERGRTLDAAALREAGNVLTPP